MGNETGFFLFNFIFAGLIKYLITHNDSFSQGFFEQVSCVFYTSFINEPGSEYRQYIALMVR